MTASPDLSSIRRILIIKLRAVGDVLLSTIVTKNIRLAFPAATIHFLTQPDSRDMLKGNPFIDDCIVYDRKSMSGWALIRRVRQQRYDLILDLFGNPRTALLTRLSGARIRVGYRFRGRAYAYNVLTDPRGDKVHNTQFNLDAIESLGIAIQDRSVYFSFSDDDALYVDEFWKNTFPSGAFVVCINTGGGWYTKRWGVDRFAVLADRLVEEFGARIVLSWGPGQLQEVQGIKSGMKHEALIPPATTLPQLGALLQRCTIVVSNDSGPMHIAAAVGSPVLGIFGPTNPDLQGPYGDRHVIVRNETLDCLGCNLTSCPIGHPCMLALSVEDVLKGVRELLRKNRITP